MGAGSVIPVQVSHDYCFSFSNRVIKHADILARISLVFYRHSTNTFFLALTIVKNEVFAGIMEG
jgi:hypothetical protein